MRSEHHAKNSISTRSWKKEYTNLTNGQDIVNIEALEQRPHSEIDIDQPTTEIQTAGEARDDLKACLRGMSSIRSRRCIEANQLTRARRGVRQDLADLQGVRLNILGEPSPRQGQVVTHQVVNRKPRDESYDGL